MPRCPYCGTRAEELVGVRVEPPPPSGFLVEAELERRLLIWAPPVVFFLAIAAMRAPMFHRLARTFVTMWLHELGHALCGWMTGYGAVPGPWRTSISDARMPLVTTLLVLLLLALAYRAWVREERGWMLGLAGAATAALAGATLVSAPAARTLFTFGGDAGMMFLGAALVLGFWAPVGSHVHTSWLRWGFLVIGALAMVEGFMTWWPARADPSVIAYGQIEGVGLSDPSKLVDVHGWSQQQMIRRYCDVALISAAVVTGRWLLGLWQLRRR